LSKSGVAGAHRPYEEAVASAENGEAAAAAESSTAGTASADSVERLRKTFCCSSRTLSNSGPQSFVRPPSLLCALQAWREREGAASLRGRGRTWTARGAGPERGRGARESRASGPSLRGAHSARVLLAYIASMRARDRCTLLCVALLCHAQQRIARTYAVLLAYKF
jgi:hypothetical protein